MVIQEIYKKQPWSNHTISGELSACFANCSSNIWISHSDKLKNIRWISREWLNNIYRTLAKPLCCIIAVHAKKGSLNETCNTTVLHFKCWKRCCFEYYSMVFDIFIIKTIQSTYRSINLMLLQPKSTFQNTRNTLPNWP